MKQNNVYLGKFYTSNPDDDVFVGGEKFSIDPRMIEVEVYLGNSKLRQYIKDYGLKYIRVVCHNKRSYIFTN